MSPFDKAVKAIKSERMYQDAKLGSSRRENTDDNRELGSLILFMDTYTNKAKAAFSGPHPEGKAEALEQVRKVAALGVLVMELYGAPLRAFE